MGTPPTEPEKPRRSDLSDQVEQFQRNVSESVPAAAASYSLIGAIILLGALGYLADRWLDTAPWLLLLGLFLGIIVGFYELVRLVWGRNR
jgi:F0F1-type ATP synthase assembly protein I